MFEMNLDRQYYINDNSDRVNKLAAKIWEAVNEIDYDPMHPLFDTFDDPIKDCYTSAAAYLILVNDGVVDLDSTIN